MGNSTQKCIANFTGAHISDLEPDYKLCDNGGLFSHPVMASSPQTEMVKILYKIYLKQFFFISSM